MAKTLHLVFPAGVTPEAARKRTGDAVFTLPMLDLAPFNQAKQESVGSMRVDRWKQEGKTSTAIDLTVDETTNVSFISVISDDAAHAEEVAKKLNEFLVVPGEEHFIEAALRNPDDPDALVRAAIAYRQDEHPGLRDAIVQRLSDQRPEIRRAAIKSAALLTWPVFVPALRAAADRETDAELRKFIQIAIRKCSGAAS